MLLKDLVALAQSNTRALPPCLCCPLKGNVFGRCLSHGVLYKTALVAELPSDCSCWRPIIHRVPDQRFDYFEDPSCRGVSFGSANRGESFQRFPTLKVQFTNREAPKLDLRLSNELKAAGCKATVEIAWGVDISSLRIPSLGYFWKLLAFFGLSI